MEQLTSTIDHIQQNLMLLSGAVNAQVEQFRSLEQRCLTIEQRFTRDEEQDLPFSPPNEQELESIKKLPDCVRDIQVFDGDQTQFVSWVHNVESILRDYDVVKKKPIFRAILKHIRQKIRGPADSALVSYNIFDEDWPQIKKCLSLYYADKRDLQSLENQLIVMRQNRNSVDKFYSDVNHQLSLIINKIKTDDYSLDASTALITNYRNRALDVFIRGLQQNLSHLVKVQRPTTLPEAYACCLELQNMEYRRFMTNDYHEYNPRQFNDFNSRNRFSQHRQFPNSDNRASVDQAPRKFQDNFRPSNNFQRNQCPNYPPTNPTPQNDQNQLPPPRPVQPKPPIPMEIDPSIRSARVNYMNRPNAVVRNSNMSSNIPRKAQRLFNLDSEDNQEDPQPEEESPQTEEEYLQQFREENEEINFMTEASPVYLT